MLCAMSLSSILRKALDVSLVVFFVYSAMYMDDKWIPAKRGFACDDTSIRLQKLGNTVPSIYIPSISLFMIHIMLVLDVFVLHVPVAEVYDCYISFFIGGSLVHFTSNLLKYNLGMLRPHFLDACQPDWIKIDCSQGLVLDYQCQKTDKEARTSFPSGHAVLTSFTMVYTIVYIQKRFMNGRYRHRIWTCVQTLCVGWAVYVPFTRVLDGWHHVMDVVAGCILGTALAVVMIFQWSSLYGKNGSIQCHEDAVLRDGREAREQLLPALREPIGACKQE